MILLKLTFGQIFFSPNMKNNKEKLEYNKEYSITHTQTYFYGIKNNIHI